MMIFDTNLNVIEMYWQNQNVYWEVKLSGNEKYETVISTRKKCNYQEKKLDILHSFIPFLSI